jgi:hypothetical protein
MKDEVAIRKIDEQINEIEAKLNDPKLGEGTASVMTRVSGYYRKAGNKMGNDPSSSSFNVGKYSEYADRTEYALA